MEASCVERFTPKPTIMTNTIANRGAIQTILSAGLVAGCFDLLTAILVYSVVMERTTDRKLLQGIGKAVFGNNIENETNLALSGVGVHFFIAFCFSIFY